MASKHGACCVNGLPGKGSAAGRKGRAVGRPPRPLPVLGLFGLASSLTRKPSALVVVVNVGGTGLLSAESPGCARPLRTCIALRPLGIALGPACERAAGRTGRRGTRDSSPVASREGAAGPVGLAASVGGRAVGAVTRGPGGGKNAPLVLGPPARSPPAQAQAPRCHCLFV
ncbi:hypothetical protein P7K49_012270 [Saguinus oedipus]|uniref:Uncharacterized protein n=1 Tax=Saguinus oedipus TaxID=9490 RepID=A0ABQ9VVC9_SAGOE|nr:hypothetical protein P7K49_012270 [Saguinus oedipus]